MRPQEVNRNINLAFKRFNRDNSLNHFQKCKKHLEARLEWFCETDPKDVDNLEPYYADYDRDKINSLIYYISDRWNCPGRIKFMLEVINRGF